MLSFRNRGTEDIFDGVNSGAAPAIDWSHCAETATANTASASISNIAAVSFGRRDMPKKSKSQTTTELSAASGAERVTDSKQPRRLPSHRPPTPPGEMLLEEFLKPLEITQTAFALRLGVSFPRLNELIRGKRSLTPDTALRLERVLGKPADFWLGLQQDWDLWNARREIGSALESLVPLES